MRTRIIHTEIWVDDFFNSLSAKEKLLFIYFLTNDQVNIIHLYKLPESRIKADTGIDTLSIQYAIGKFQRAGKIYFNRGFIYLRNAGRFESYKGQLNEIAKKQLFEKLPPDIFDWYRKILDTPIDTPIDTLSIVLKTINHKSKIINPNKDSNNNGRSITPSNIDEISKKYKLPETFVLLQKEKMENWEKAKGKIYKDRVAALRNWVLRAAEEKIEGRRKNDRYGYTEI